MRCLDSITDSMDMNLSKLRETVEERGAWCAIGWQRIGHDLAIQHEQQPETEFLDPWCSNYLY